ncbi:uncharacterized protein N7515_005131 [Penicillium bovifimosum]|uniref:Uncharacterized protein n=1 Tax=Penicillium bovifimosum TaxID=126998 RepID=A0A9W9H1T4_9EURO|nr:uncharacterized protein N7515_005131 [Penicillium bovifimosum]KAJ5135853.1 hypothetical protein N7515_005131 [Penicillium bovifimosum]
MASILVLEPLPSLSAPVLPSHLNPHRRHATPSSPAKYLSSQIFLSHTTHIFPVNGSSSQHSTFIFEFV